MANIIKLGNLCLDGHPVEIGTDYVSGQSIEIRDTTSGQRITWVVVNGMLIADRCILEDISWDDLVAQGLVFGKEVTVRGFRFIVRLLQVGADEGVPNEWDDEWDAALDAVGEDDALWHWDRKFFWGQGSVGQAGQPQERRVLRGYYSARFFDLFTASIRLMRLGFRPALAPLPTEQFAPALLGQRLMLWGGQNIADGCLEQVTDYDVVLTDWSGTVLDNPNSGWAIVDGKLVAARETIMGMQTQKGA